jgi:hypothetical protein
MTGTGRERVHRRHHNGDRLTRPRRSPRPASAQRGRSTEARTSNATRGDAASRGWAAGGAEEYQTRLHFFKFKMP